MRKNSASRRELSLCLLLVERCCGGRGNQQPHRAALNINLAIIKHNSGRVPGSIIRNTSKTQQLIVVAASRLLP